MLAVSWVALPVGVVVAAAVCTITLWRSSGADEAYRRAVVLHGEERSWWEVGRGRKLLRSCSSGGWEAGKLLSWGWQAGMELVTREQSKLTGASLLHRGHHTWAHPAAKDSLPLLHTGPLRTRLNSPKLGIAAIIELLAEPFYIIASTQLRFGLRAGIDTAAMMLRGALTLALLLHTRLPPALVFSAAQLAFAGVYLLGYLLFAAVLAAQVGGGSDE